MFVEKLKLSNYMSFPKLELDFEPDTIYIITGENKDIGGKNGIGKSALVESIVYSIYGKNIRVGSKDVKELITNGKRELKTEIHLSNNILIQRWRTKTKSQVKVQRLNETGEVVEDLTRRTNTETENLINQILIPFDKFVYVSYFNPQSLVFFSLTPKQKFEVIEELLNLTIIDEVHEEYKSKYAEIQRTLQKTVSDITNIDTQIRTYEEFEYKTTLTIEELKQQLTKIEQYKYQLRNKYRTELNEKIKAYQDRLRKLKQSIGDTETKLEQLRREYPDTDNIETKLEQLQEQLTTKLQLLSKYTNIKNQIDRALSKGKCPVCLREFDGEHDKDRMVNLLSEGEITSYDDLVSVITKLESEIELLKEQKTQLGNIYAEYQDLKTRLSDYTNRYNLLINQIKETEPHIYEFIFNYNNSAIYKFIDEKVDSEVKIGLEQTRRQLQYNEQELQKIRATINQLNQQITKLQKEKEHLETELDILSKVIHELSFNGEFRQTLIRYYLSELETVINQMIKELNPNFELKITIEQSGRYKGIQVSIFDAGIEKSYGQLSTGEKRMVDIALLLTLSSFTTSFLIIDEALDNLSYENQLRVIRLLSTFNKQIFLVTHNEHLIEELNNLKNIKVRTIHITKENGISTVEVI